MEEISREFIIIETEMKFFVGKGKGKERDAWSGHESSGSAVGGRWLLISLDRLYRARREAARIEKLEHESVFTNRAWRGERQTAKQSIGWSGRDRLCGRRCLPATQNPSAAHTRSREPVFAPCLFEWFERPADPADLSILFFGFCVTADGRNEWGDGH